MIDWSGFSGKRVCAAVSGGMDSVSLLHMLKGEAERCGFFLSAVHCEHGIRGEASLSDARFVGELCRDWEIPLFVFSADCPAEAAAKGVGLEAAAREFRYRSFESLLAEGKADFIATAHHLDDEAETVLFRLCRGASLTGAKGMTERRGKYLRPLLSCTRAQITAYAKEKGLAYREDESNKDAAFTRNKLRLEVLPRLEEAVPGAAGNLAAFARRAAEDDDFLYALSDDLFYKSGGQGSGDGKIRLHFSPAPSLFRRACLTALRALGADRDYTAKNLDDAFRLQSLQTGSRVSLPRGIVAEREYECIAFYKPQGAEGENSGGGEWHAPFREGITDGGRVEIIVTSGGLPADIWGRALLLDKDKVPENAAFRLRREGDFIEKFGGGRRTIKRYLIDKKVPRAMRETLPLLADESGEVYAVCGVEISEKLRVSPGAAGALKMAVRMKKETDK